MPDERVATGLELDAETEGWIARRVTVRAYCDIVLAVLVFAFALVLAAVPIRNSDIWLHLATGRHLITEFGSGSVGADPFAHTADGAGSASATWVFDVLCYSVHWVGGSLALGIFKMIAVGLLAGVILRTGWTDGGAWIAAICAMLTMVAIAPWLHLQPMLWSLGLLALALWYLECRTAPLEGCAGTGGNGWFTFWPFYLLLVVWVNSDSWFLLGLLMLACYWLGGLVVLGRLRRPRIPTLAVCASLVVCLANPQGYRAYRLPIELTLPLQYPSLASDSVFRPLFQSPLGREFYDGGPAWSAAGLAMAGILGLALIGLVLNRAGRHIPRLLVCLMLLGLAVYQVRNLPFLMVALAILTPRAVHEFAAAQFRDRADAVFRLRQAVTARTATIPVALALLVMAWVGMLQSGRPEPRALGVETDPGLIRAAEQMSAWRREHKPGAQAWGFNFSPDIANYFAWFCPDEKSFLHSRLEVCARAAPDYVALRQGLSGTATVTGSSDHSVMRPGEWREILRRHGVDHVVLADRDRERTQAALRHVLAAPDEWQVLFQAGRVVVLGWRDRAARNATAASWNGLDLSQDGLHCSQTEKAPGVPPDRPADPAWWDHLVPRAHPPSIDRDEAALRLMIAESLRLPTRRSAARKWEAGLAAASVGHALAGDLTTVALLVDWLPKSWSAPPRLTDLTAASPLSQRLLATYLAQRDESPPGQLWAGVRAGRRALFAPAQDAETYLLLGQLYCRLAWHTSERTWGPRLAVLGQVRKQQAIAALERAVQIKPDLDQAHGLLVQLYTEVGLLDIALRHLQAFEKLQRQRLPAFSDAPEALERIAADIAQMERGLLDRENAYERGQGNLSLANRARLAQSVGLADKALEILLATDVTAFGGPELQAALELLLWTGRADEAREWLKPQHLALLGEFEYHWLAARVDLAAGDYAGGEEHLGKLIVRSAIVPELRGRVDLEIAIPIAVGNYVLAGLQQAVTPQTLFAFNEIEPQLRIQMLSNQVARSAEFATLEGVMLIERGDAPRAERYLRQALDMTQHNDQSLMSYAADFGIRPIASYYLNLLSGSAKEPGSKAGGP
jgi:tetratricopeptide (TPR) repeat protein